MPQDVSLQGGATLTGAAEGAPRPCPNWSHPRALLPAADMARTQHGDRPNIWILMYQSPWPPVLTRHKVFNALIRGARFKVVEKELHNGVRPLLLVIQRGRKVGTASVFIDDTETGVGALVKIYTQSPDILYHFAVEARRSGVVPCEIPMWVLARSSRQGAWVNLKRRHPKRDRYTANGDAGR